MKKLFTISALLFLSTAQAIVVENNSFKQNESIKKEKYDFSRFQKKTEFKVQGIKTPKVVRFSTIENLGNKTILLNSKNEVINHKTEKKYLTLNSQINSVSASSQLEGFENNLIDNNSETMFSFSSEDDRHTITMKFNSLIKISAMQIDLSDDVVSPKKLSLSGKLKNGKFAKILDDYDYRSYLNFPSIEVEELEITFFTRNFLRIDDIEIFSDTSKSSNALIFFAEEGETYTLYSHPVFGYKMYYLDKNYRSLQTDKKTPQFVLPKIRENFDFNFDYDGDGLNDDVDLCPKVLDRNNMDIDNNGRGDVCEDPDLDRLQSFEDNCPYKYNPDQSDIDNDGIGDECDKEENRWTETKQYLIWVAFALMAGTLIFLIARK